MTITTKQKKTANSPDILSGIRLTNSFALIACVIFCISGMHNMDLGDLPSGIFLETLGALSLLTFVFNRLKMVRWSVSYIFLLITGAIFYFDSYSGFESGTYLFYFPLLFAIANVFDYRSAQRRLVMLLHILLVITLPVIHLATHHRLFESVFLTDLQRGQMFIFNLSFSIACMGYFVYLLVKANIERMNLMEHILAEENKLRRMQEEKNKEKEILLAELQHRLQNNLSLMTSLLRIKQETVNSDTYKMVFREIFHALQTVAHAHRLQKFDDGKLLVPLKDYLTEIDKHWEQLSQADPEPYTVNWSCPEQTLNIKQCITLGLIFHESIVMFAIHQRNVQEKQQLFFEITNEDPFMDIRIQSTVPELFRTPEDDLLIYSLIEQLDAVLTRQTSRQYSIRFRVNAQAIYLESERLFND